MYVTIKLLSKILGSLPLGFSLFLGRRIGSIFYHDRKKRFIAYRNLKLAFPRKSNHQILSILKRSFMNFGMAGVESLMITKIIESNLINFEELDNLSENHIIVTVHEASWEVYVALFATRYNFAVLAQEQKNKGFQRFLSQERQKNNIKICFSLKSLVDYIKKGYWAGLVIDHGAEDNAPLVEFFGNLVPTPQGSVYLAKKFNKKIYPSFSYRENNKFHTILLAEPLDCKDLSSLEVLKKLNSIYEGFLEKYPDQYMWWYKRFKKKHNLHIIILNDGKTGHVKQSQAVLNIFKELDYEIQETVVEIGYLKKRQRFFLEVCAVSSDKGCLGCARCLRFLLDKDIYEELSTTFADVVISTGSQLAPINLILSNCLGAKSLVILKPNLGVDKFDLALIPEHDRLSGKNIVNIKGALSYPSRIEQDGSELINKFKLSQRKKISLFVGGPIENHQKFIKNFRFFVHRFKDFALKNDCGLLISTSRRTPLYLENFIEKEFKNFSHTETLIIANRKNYPFILGGFLSLSYLVFVTSDSISMISESLNVGKTTVCVCVEKISRAHHVNFYTSVKKLTTFLNYPYIISKLNIPSYTLFEHNKERVKEAIKSIL